MRRFSPALSVLLLAAAIGAAAAANPPSVAAAISSNADLSLLQAKLELYSDILAELGPAFAGTVFAPSDAAIRNAEKAGVVVSSDILKYHIVPGPPAPVTSLNDDQIYITDQGETLQAQYTDGKLTIIAKGSNAHIINADTMIGIAEYAVLHVIDNVLLPYAPAKPLLPVGAAGGAASGGSATGSGTGGRPAGGKTPVAGGTVGAASLDDTVPAPQGSMDGPGIVMNSTVGAPVEGVSSSPEPSVESPALPPVLGTLLDVADAANLTSVVALVEGAGLSGLFGPDFNGTVFLPTNEAIDAFVASAGPEIDNADAVTAILAYHVVPDKAWFAADLEDGLQLTTLNGQTLTVKMIDGTASLVTATGQEVPIIVTDIEAGPAVLHIVDSVLVPKSDATDASTPVAPAPTEAPPASSATTLASCAAVAASLLAAALLF